MSGIAGIIHFDGQPVAPGLIESMTHSMQNRGPDGIHHWRRGSVALGHCMLRTTPESLEENQPLANEDESLVLVMDGRVDNGEDLRRDLLGRGAILRDRTDAELVLRAYEVWGAQCPDRIIGEFAFFVWDERRRTLFGARDAAGTRHFYYHAGQGWFGFASEIKGLLATGLIAARLNESRVLDYLVVEYDRDDQIGTFYQDIVRLPAGHAIEISAQGARTWRYWEPGNLTVNKFASLEECAEAFLDQLRVAVKCRLRSNGPVGAMLSGGLDSSSIVGLIRKEFRGDLQQPLKTISLIREDRENCKDWQHIQEMLKEGWIDPVILTSATGGENGKARLDNIARIDEPFALSHGLTYAMVYESGQRQGCRVVLDGMAGDLLFYGVDRSLDAILRGKLLGHLPDVFAAFERHGFENRTRTLLIRSLAAVTPPGVRAVYRRLREKRRVLQDDLALLRRDKVIPWLAEKRRQARQEEAAKKPGNDQAAHARSFTSGLLSFPHEVYGQIAFASGVEPRSPFSDRRMIEFAIQIPVAAKLGVPWYKNLLREATAGVLPERVGWRCDLGNHPGWKAYERLISATAESRPEIWNPEYLSCRLNPWVDHERLFREWAAHERDPVYEKNYQLFTMAILARWIDANPAFVERTFYPLP
jgi:asparagine synthase (glutamine-hydrolysing)